MREQLDIIYCDRFLVAVNKPEGLLVHRTSLDRHETRFAVQILRDQLGQRVYPVHRLDKPTSGVLLFALDSAVARQLAADFADRKVEKSYLAVVRGWTDAQGEIDHPLVDGPEGGSGVRQKGGDVARPALTCYRTLAQTELPVALGRYATSRYSLLDVRPQSGRRHQIRRHCKHIFHPVIGDTRYGEGRHNRLFREEFACRRMLLHARSLRIRHPVSGMSLPIIARLPEDFRLILDRVNLVTTTSGVLE